MPVKPSLGKAGASSRLNSTSTGLALLGTSPVDAFHAVSSWVTFLAVLIWLVRLCLYGLELLSVGKELVGCCRWFGTCCCKKRCRHRKCVNRWQKIVGSEACYELEKRKRHERSLKARWSLWGQLSAGLKNPYVGAPKTWNTWGKWSNKLRKHVWHIRKKAREALAKEQ